ncbi:carbohydrate kinase family protein [Peribacillus loiseleuriae]|uniref:Carbohydrate kinase PfkB domain-containing protein n=1 Tax=Peribacillus loiseleuriae TaxID=1679170 RepID=A0A0K9GXX8_9BACI|nr:PfkB family carbohydrate kinase [Peribacillus loiseleuriae]KMY51498.1 hypothetical protein AC625_19745 [Peribacillus loiseleuriae]
MKKEIDLIASGYPSIDYIVRLPETPKLGRTSIIQNKEHKDPYFGGCNVNIAYLCSTMNRKTMLSMRVGNDFFKSGFKTFLEEGGVNTSNLQVIEEDVTSTSQLIMNEAGNHITLFYPGAMNEKYPVLIDENSIKKSRFGVITVGDPLYNLKFADMCIKHQVPLVFGMKCDFEAFTPENLMKIMQHSELIFMNESEQLALEECLPINSIIDFLSNGITKHIIVTLGSKGSKIFSKQEKNTQEEIIGITKPECVTDTTGVGDAYIAGFLHAYMDGKSIRQCGQSGSVMASFIIEKQGCLTNKPTKMEFYSRYKNQYQEEF